MGDTCVVLVYIPSHHRLLDTRNTTFFKKIINNLFSITFTKPLQQEQIFFKQKSITIYVRIRNPPPFVMGTDLKKDNTNFGWAHLSSLRVVFCWFELFSGYCHFTLLSPPKG